MPRQPQAPYLYFREQRVHRNGTVERAQYVIRDGQRQRATGFAKHEIVEANRALAAYFAEKHNPRRSSASDPASARVVDALNVYTQDMIENLADSQRQREAAGRIKRLAGFFATTCIVGVSADQCKAYVKQRGAKMAARRELEDLRSALNHFAVQGYCTVTPKVWLPEKNKARKEWLTVKQAARLLRAAWQMRQAWGTDESDRRIGRHLAHFIVVALHSGTRRTVTCSAALERAPGLPYFDLDEGIFYRTPDNAKPTRKNRNQTPQRVPPHLLAHLRRWQRLGHRFAVEWNGLPPKKINKAFRHACELAGLGPEIVPHTLRHSCVTWMLKNGITVDLTAGYVGMTRELVETTYGHHCPEHQAVAANHRNSARARKLAEREAVEFQKTRRARLALLRSAA